MRKRWRGASSVGKQALREDARFLYVWKEWNAASRCCPGELGYNFPEKNIFVRCVLFPNESSTKKAAKEAKVCNCPKVCVSGFQLEVPGLLTHPQFSYYFYSHQSLIFILGDTNPLNVFNKGIKGILIRQL